MRRFGLLILGMLLLGLGGCGSGGAPSPRYLIAVSGTKIALNDANLFLSPYNWNLDATGTATTVQPGAYLTGGFQSANIRLDLDTSSLAVLRDRVGPMIRWQVDDATPQVYQLVAGDVQIPLNAAPLSAGPHTFKVWFLAADYGQDRWNLPAESLRITGVTLDEGGTTTVPALQPKRILFFGDSITEGVHTESASKDPVRDDNARHAYPTTCAAALNAEFGVVGFARQGWTVPAQEGSNVPSFVNAWKLQFAGTPRLFTPAPDYVVVMEGPNDFSFGVAPAQLQAAVQAWLADARAVLPSTRLCIAVPFGGFERAPLTQAVQAYKAAHPADTNVFLIDLGVGIQTGLTDFSGRSSKFSHDGLHPDAATSQRLGALLADAIQAAAP